MDKIKAKILRELMDSKGSLELFDTIHETSSSSESSEDEDEQAERFMQKIDNYSEEDFKSQFRLNRSTVDFIVSKYFKFVYTTSAVHHGGRPRIGCKKEILLFLFYLGNMVTFNELGDLFEIRKSSAWFAVGRVSSWLVTIGHEYVKWPQRNEAKENARNFGALTRIPGVLGAINCTRIKTNCTNQSKQSTTKRKRNISIVFQAVVDANKKFIDIDMSCGDSKRHFFNESRMLMKSVLHRKARANYKNLFPYNTFLIGSSAYPNSDWLIPPFNNESTLTERHEQFNKLHLLTQKIAIDTLALLKSRFRRVTTFTEQRSIKGVMNIVASACILHNICVIMDDTFEIKESEESPDESECIAEEYPQNLEVDRRRQLLFDYMCQRKII